MDNAIRATRVNGSANGDHAKILVLDDEDDLIALYSAQLMSLGYEVISANNGSAALDQLKNNTDTALLMADVSLGGEMSGVEVAEKARRINPNLPIVFVSGADNKSLIEDGGFDGKVSLLQKPFRKADLGTCVSGILQTDV